MPKLVFKLSDTQSLDFPLAGDFVRLGRNAANDIVIDNLWISSFHAEFRLNPDGVTEVRDLHSSNGTTVNGRRIECALLNPGDIVGFGQLEATFDPVPENLTGANGSETAAGTAADSPPPPAALSGPRLAKLIPAAAATVPLPGLPRSAATEPVPTVNPGGRLATPAAPPPTTPVPVSEISTDVRREVQQAHAELTNARRELKSLSGQIETLRREREGEEHTQAQIRLQGEREARELRSRLEKLQEEIEKTEAAGTASAKARGEKLSAEEAELSKVTLDLETSRQEADAAAARVAAREEAATTAAEHLAKLTSETEALIERRAALDEKLKDAESQLSEHTSRIAAAGESLRELDDAKARLAEIEAAVADAKTKAKTADESAKADEKKKAALAKELAAAGDEQTKIATALSRATAELSVLEEQRRVAAAAAESERGEAAEELATLTKSVAEQKTALEAAAARLADLEESTVAAADRFAKAESDAAGMEKSVSDRQSLLSSSEAEAAVISKKIEDARRELSNEESLVTELEQRKAALTADVESLAAKRKEMASVESSLEEVTGRLNEASTAIAQKQTLLAKLNLEAAAATSAAAQALEAQAKATRSGEEVVENQRKLAVVVGDISALAEKRAAANRALKESTAELETLTSSITAARAESAALEPLRSEAAALQVRTAELETKIRQLEDRKQTFAEAPDANWGTVHAMAKGIIKQVDLLDDLIHHQVVNNGAREAIEQMSIFRAGLSDILTEYHVEPYQYEPDFIVEVSTRKKIQIVESREGSSPGTRIEKTWRPGYICNNGAIGVQTLLRKAEVSIVTGK